jgi:hypothetical protein
MNPIAALQSGFMMNGMSPFLGRGMRGNGFGGRGGGLGSRGRGRGGRYNPY